MIGSTPWPAGEVGEGLSSLRKGGLRLPVRNIAMTRAQPPSAAFGQAGVAALQRSSSVVAEHRPEHDHRGAARRQIVIVPAAPLQTAADEPGEGGEGGDAGEDARASGRRQRRCRAAPAPGSRPDFRPRRTRASRRRPFVIGERQRQLMREEGGMDRPGGGDIGDADAGDDPGHRDRVAARASRRAPAGSPRSASAGRRNRV